VQGRCRYAFFQSALAIAIVIFGFWQGETSIFGGAVSEYGTAVRAVAWVLLFLVLMLLLHTAMYLLPLYALTVATVKFSCRQAVVDFARNAHIRPDLVTFLDATAVQEVRTTRMPCMHLSIGTCRCMCARAGTALMHAPRTNTSHMCVCGSACAAIHVRQYM
jgi:hypothetical protein